MPDGSPAVDFEKIKAQLRQRADAAQPVADSPSTSRLIDAAQLQHQHFEPIKYVIPGYVPEGLSILAGKPKLGKSWLSLDWAIAVAYGGTTMESITCDQGDVLYAALEDNPRRLQSRMQTLLPDPQMPWPERLQFATSMNTLDQGGVEFIRDWIEQAVEPRLVIVDTLQKVRGSRSDRETAYESDYKAVAALQALAAEKGVAIVLVHHVRKLDADDPIDKVSGTLGLTGCADTTLVLDRKGGGSCTLYGRGRDTEEIEQAVEFGKESCRWSILGDAGRVQRSDQRQAILDVLAEAGEPVGPTDIGAAADMQVGNVRKLLFYMARDGQVEKVGRGRYQLPGGNDGNDGNENPGAAENCASQDVTGGSGSGNVDGNDAANVTGFTDAVTNWHCQNPPQTAPKHADVTHVTDVTGGSGA